MRFPAKALDIVFQEGQYKNSNSAGQNCPVFNVLCIFLLNISILLPADRRMPLYACAHFGGYRAPRGGYPPLLLLYLELRACPETRRRPESHFSKSANLSGRAAGLLFCRAGPARSSGGRRRPHRGGGRCSPFSAAHTEKQRPAFAGPFARPAHAGWGNPAKPSGYAARNGRAAGLLSRPFQPL